MFFFCSIKVNPHWPTGSLFSDRSPGKIVREGQAVWMSGKKESAKVDGFGEPNWPHAASATIRR
jgi:hypothetical protein